MKEGNQITVKEDEITLKELILKVQEFYREVLRNWKIVAVFLVLGGSYFLYTAITTPVTYVADMTFMVNEESGGSNGGMGSILGQFGLGGGGGGEFNLDKIAELSKSLRITKEALFEKAVVKNKLDYFANHIIKAEQIHEKWKKDTTGLKDFYFTNSEIEKFGKTERRALKIVYNQVKGNPNIEPLMLVYYEKETSILTMEVESQSEELSILFLKELYEKVSQFYIKESTDKPKATFDKLKEKRDSISQELARKESLLAKAIDSNIGLVSRSAQLKIDRLQRDVQMLSVAYAEIVKNTEMAAFNLKIAMPFFQVIDEPFSPLRPNRESKIKAIILGAFLGSFLAIIIIIGRKIYRDAMV